MGLFNKLFNQTSTGEQKNKLPWIDLVDVTDLNRIETESDLKPQIIFKHSTRCGISRMVKNTFENSYPLTSDEADLFYLDLLAHRNISKEIAERFDVVHESPQLIIIKKGQVVKHASHGRINDLDLKTLL